MTDKQKIIRTATVPLSLDLFCRGLFRELAASYDVVALSSPQPELEQIRRREGVRTIGVPMQRKIAPLRDLFSLCRMTVVFRREKPQLVHSITPKAGLLSMMAAWAARVPVRVHTFTGLIFPYEKGWKRHLLRLTDRITAACATAVIPEGEGVKEDLIRFGVTSKPLQVLGNGNLRGIDLHPYRRTEALCRRGAAIREAFGIPATDFVFVFVGRLDRDKGLDDLVPAFLRLSQERGDVRLLLVGAGEPDGRPVLERTWHEIDQSDRIHCSDGWQTDVRPYYAAADALVHPSLREGFPNVVIEAGAMQLPSIVTDINGSREIVSEGINGTVVPPRDPEALYRQMKSFAEQPEQVRRMGLAARDLAGR